MVATRGFTLVEVLVVLALVGLAGSAVMLTLPAGRDALAQQSQAFGNSLQHARDEAILGMRTIEVTVTAEGYGFTRQRLGIWQPLLERPFGNVLWQDGVEPRLAQDQAQIGFRFDPTGTSEARALTLQHAGRAVRVAVDGAGKVRIDDIAH